MSVKILIYRNIIKEQEPVIRPLLKQLHMVALSSNGYISGEALISGDNLEENLIISSWESLNYWEEYLENEKSREIQFQIDQVLGQSTRYKVYFVR